MRFAAGGFVSCICLLLVALPASGCKSVVEDLGGLPPITIPVSQIGVVVGEPNPMRRQLAELLLKSLIEERSSTEVLLSDVIAPHSGLEAHALIERFHEQGCDALLIVIPQSASATSLIQSSEGETFAESMVVTAFEEPASYSRGEGRRGFEQTTRYLAYLVDPRLFCTGLSISYVQYASRQDATQSLMDGLLELADALERSDCLLPK